MADSGSSPRGANRARSVARKLAVQALYQWQLNHQPWQDLLQQYSVSEDMARADRDYFRELIEKISADAEQLEALLTPFVDRPISGLDPIERAILLIGVYELRARVDVPYRVAINEGVELARRFGATESHKYINAVLDRAAAQLRAGEYR